MDVLKDISPHIYSMCSLITKTRGEYNAHRFLLYKALQRNQIELKTWLNGAERKNLILFHIDTITRRWYIYRGQVILQDFMKGFRLPGSTLRKEQFIFSLNLNVTSVQIRKVISL